MTALLFVLRLYPIGVVTGHAIGSGSGRVDLEANQVSASWKNCTPTVSYVNTYRYLYDTTGYEVDLFTLFLVIFTPEPIKWGGGATHIHASTRICGAVVVGSQKKK